MERLLSANKAFFFLRQNFLAIWRKPKKELAFYYTGILNNETLCLASPSNERMVCTEIKSILIKKKIHSYISYRINAGSKAREFKALYYTVPMSVLPTLMILLWASCRQKNFPDRKLQAQQLCTRRLLIFPRTIHLCGSLTSSFIT